MSAIWKLITKQFFQEIKTISQGAMMDIISISEFLCKKNNKTHLRLLLWQSVQNISVGVNMCYAEEMHGIYKDKYKIHTEIT